MMCTDFQYGGARRASGKETAFRQPAKEGARHAEG